MKMETICEFCVKDNEVIYVNKQTSLEEVNKSIGTCHINPKEFNYFAVFGKLYFRGNSNIKL